MTECRLHVLFADDFHEDPFFPSAIKFAVEDLFPWSEIEFALRDRDHDFAAHDLPLQVRVCVVLAGSIVMVLGSGGVRRKLLQPDFVIVVETALVVIDENGGRDVHRAAEAESTLDFAFADQLFNRLRDINETATTFDFKPEIFSQRFHIRWKKKKESLPRELRRLPLQIQSGGERGIRTPVSPSSN